MTTIPHPLTDQDGEALELAEAAKGVQRGLDDFPTVGRTQAQAVLELSRHQVQDAAYETAA